MTSIRPDRPYFESWLARTRKQFSASGRLSQIALLLSRSEGGSPEHWQARLRELLDGHGNPSLDLLTQIDALLASPAKKLPPTTTQQTLW